MINNYRDLSLEKYLEIQDIEWLEMDEIDIQTTLISILADMDFEDVLDLPIPQYKKMAEQLEFLKVSPNVKPKRIDNVVINGKEFMVIKKVEDMTAGQYIDFQHYFKDKDFKMLPYILSCFIIPKGEKYGDSETIEYMKQLSVEEALMIANFFMKQSRSLIKGMLLSLEWMIRKRIWKEKDETVKMKMKEAKKMVHSLKDLVTDGDGFQVLIQSLKR